MKVMKCLFTLLIVLALNVALGESQLFQQKVNCKTFRDPLNCNAYYQCCVDKVILHKFCPVGMEWNPSEDICENNERCQNDETLNDVEDESEIIAQESDNYLDCMLLERPRRPGRPPGFVPPVVRPPNNGSIQMKLNNKIYYMLLLVAIVQFSHIC